MKFILPYWVIWAIIRLIQLIYTLFIGSVLAFYVRFSQDRYANSIRWSCTGGIFEMIELLWNSCRFVPKRTTAVMVLAVIATLSTLSASNILIAMISRVDKESNPAAIGVLTTQIISMDPLFWSTDLGSKSTVEEALISMLSDTRRNPNPQQGIRYTPRTYAFEAACNDSIAYFTEDGFRGIPFPYETIKCKAHTLYLNDGFYFRDLSNAHYYLFDSSTFLLRTSFVHLGDIQKDLTMEPFFFTLTPKQMCSPNFPTIELGLLFNVFPREGMIVQPKTLSTKCHYGFNEESAAMSATYFQFAVGNMQEFDNVIATILDDPTSLPLLEYMKAAIDEGIFESPTNNSTLVMLTKNPSTASDVDFLLCFSKYREEQRTMGLVCTYILTSVIVVSPQAVDPAIAANLNRGSEPRDYINATQHFTITIHHNLQNSGQDEGKKPSPLFSSAQLIKATADATRYLASLGHNVYIYKDQDSQTDQLYILFDTVELKDGYEISSAAFVAICALTALFLLIFAISEKFFSTVYNSTLYKTIYKEINTKIESVPMLLHYTRDPLAFDDHQVIYSSGEHLNVISETQGHPMASLKHRNSVPMPDHQQDLHSPDVTTVHHSRLSSLSITSTQFASPVTTN